MTEATPAHLKPPAPNLGRRAAIASFYTVAARIILRCIGLVSTLILVRLLSPADFGLIGLASVVYGILDSLTATGFGMAIIRMEAPRKIHYDTAWTLTMMRGALISAALVLSSHLQARLMGDPRIAGLMHVLAITAMLQSLENIRLVELQRNLQFDKIMIYTVLTKIVGFVIVVPLAFYMRNYWPLLLSPMLMRFITIPYSYWLAPYRPRFSLAAWREFFHFSKWLSLGNICTIMDMNFITILIGRVLGLFALGTWQVVYQVAALPISEIVAPIRQPLYSLFSRSYTDLTLLRQHFLRSLEIQALIILPLSIGIALTAPEAAALFLGPKWPDATALLPIIALYALVDAIAQYTGSIFIVMNRQKGFVVTYAAILVVRIPILVWAALHDGLHGTVLAVLGTGFFNVVIWWSAATKLMELPLRQVARTVWRPIVAVALMAGWVALLRWRMSNPLAGVEHAAADLAVYAATGAVVYIGAIMALWVAQGRPEEAAEAHMIQTISGLGRMLQRAFA